MIFSFSLLVQVGGWIGGWEKQNKINAILNSVEVVVEVGVELGKITINHHHQPPHTFWRVLGSVDLKTPCFNPITWVGGTGNIDKSPKSFQAEHFHLKSC